MAVIVGIAGPSCTGKTTLLNLVNLNRDKFNRPIQISPDLKDVTWKDILDTTKNFTEYDEIYADKEYLLIFCGRLLTKYKELLEFYRSSLDDNCIAIVDFSHLDLLIYMNLHFWYHYPSQELLAEIVDQVMEMRGKLDRIYVTQADDVLYDPIKSKKSLRQRASDFKRNRRLELQYYELFSDLPVVSRLASSADTSLNMLIEDLNSRYGVINNV